MSCETIIRANRGSDVEFTFNWVDVDGNNVDLTGWTVSLMDVTAAISALATVTLTTPAVGLITVRVEWDDALTTSTVYSLRVKLVNGIEDRSTNLIRIVYE